MYVSQIDTIIDQTLDRLYTEELFTNKYVNELIEKNVITYVEYFDKINMSIEKVVSEIDRTNIQTMINSKENVLHIINIIKRYIAYYYFLYIGYYYKGSIKNYRNNLIQFSKLYENSGYHIKNFFDTENNYRLITFYKIIKDTTTLLLLTDLQKSTIDKLAMKDAILFLNRLGEDYVNNYLLIVTPDNNVEPNVHNLIKTVVFNELYQFQERHVIFNILSEIEENESEFTYIDIVVATDEISDFDSFRQLFIGGKTTTDTMAKDLFELINEKSEITYDDANIINNKLITFKGLIPIVDDFLRFHKDSVKTEMNENIPVILTDNNNKKNIQMMLRFQQRNKKENTKAQIIMNKIDAIQNLYSENVSNNPATYQKIKQLFYEPYIHRKAVLNNYFEELDILSHIKKAETYITTIDEYYLEMLNITTHAYFNFKDFLKFGMHLHVESDKTINMLRYCNIEYQHIMPRLEVDTTTSAHNALINLVGLAIGPLNGDHLRCVIKENLMDIRKTSILYKKNGVAKKYTSENGYRSILKLIKYCLIDNIKIVMGPNMYLTYDYNKILEENPNIYDKVIYWIYDIETDKYKASSYESSNQKIVLSHISDKTSQKQSNVFQEVIKRMNIELYNKITHLLKNKLEKTIQENHTLSIIDIYRIIYLFIANFDLDITTQEADNLVNNFLVSQKIEKTSIPTITDVAVMPRYEPILKPQPYVIHIDVTHPLHPKKFKLIEFHDAAEKTTTKTDDIDDYNRCKHESELADIMKLRNDFTKYSIELSKFLKIYATESINFGAICKICGRSLSVVQYAQDGKFDNNIGRYVTSYSAANIPLKNLKEYESYTKTIRFLKKIVKRLSFLTGATMLSGSNDSAKQKQNAIVKQMLDLMIKHNANNMNTNHSELFEKKYGIDKKFNSSFFFELDDNIFDYDTHANTPGITEISRMKINNMILYLILIFVTELNGPQIATTNTDKYANIYVYLKYGNKLFGDLMIKRNLSDSETVPIMSYPILCYMIYLIAYLLDKYDIWMNPSEDVRKSNKTFNPFVLKNIIYSLVALFNSIAIDHSNMPDNYTYLLFTSKFYAQLNTIFADTSIINILKKNHGKYIGKTEKTDHDEIRVKETTTYLIADPIQLKKQPYKIPTFKISTGIAYDKQSNIIYQNDHNLNDKTNCDTGDFHEWHLKNGELTCAKCGKVFNDTLGTIDETVHEYYFSQNKIITRTCEHLCIAGENKIDEFCKLCHPTIPYSAIEIDSINNILDRIKNEKIEKNIQLQIEYNDIFKMVDEFQDKMITNLKTESDTKNGGLIYGIINPIIDNFINHMESIIGSSADLGIDKYPIYLKDDVYIIDHAYDKVKLETPIIMKQQDGKMLFKEQHPYFKTDVYYYSDNRHTPISVYYHAITMKLLGYKPKNKDYVVYDQSDRYMIVNPSIKNKLLIVGYDAKYIITPNDRPNYDIMDGLIRTHIQTTKSIIDNISRLLNKIKNFTPDISKTTLPLDASHVVQKIANKYSSIFSNKLDLDDAFDEWISIRDAFSYDYVDWSTTNIDESINANQLTRDGSKNLCISSELINYYDINSGIMIYYLINQFMIIFEKNTGKNTKLHIAQMYIDIINYLFGLSNVDNIKNISEIKRFNYILDGSEYAIDLLRKGHGLTESNKLDQQLQELEDAKDIPDMSYPTTVEDIYGDVDSDELDDIREEAEGLDMEFEDDEYGEAELEQESTL